LVEYKNHAQLKLVKTLLFQIKLTNKSELYCCKTIHFNRYRNRNNRL